MFRRALHWVVVSLTAGLAVALLVAAASLQWVDLSSAKAFQSAQAFDGRVKWDVSIARGPGAVRITSRRESGLAWNADQACGPPDTVRMGDERTAWASATPDGSMEWLEVYYPGSVRPVAIHIYESFNPGAIVKVTAFVEARARPCVVWQRGDPAIPLASSQPSSGVRVLRLPLSPALPLDGPVHCVRLDLNSPVVPGWNEIDAVGLEDSSGALHWASSARASSAYGISGVSDGVTPVLPYWSGLVPAPPDILRGDIKTEECVVEGRGWPMAALRATAMNRNDPVRLTGPVWAGLWVDTLFFASIAAALWWLATYPKKFLVESSRLRRGCCLRCGYDLQYDLTGGCPECGWRREPPAAAGATR